MTGLIKARQAEPGVRAFALPASPAAPSRSLEQLALDAARDEIAQLKTCLDEEREAFERACAEARETGKAAGLKAADDGAKQRAEQLEAALHDACAAWNERLARIDTLAVHLARTTLARVFADSDDLAELVRRAVARKVGTLQADSVVAVVVSASDFPDQASRDVLDACRSGGTIVTDSALASGACRIDLKLGHVDLGIGTLAAELDAAFASLLDGRPGA